MNRNTNASRVTAAGENKDTNFVLSGVSEIRDKIERACNWSGASDAATDRFIRRRSANSSLDQSAPETF